MSATARDIDLTGADLDETIAIEPSPQPGRDRPMGSAEMPKSTPQGHHRFTFSSGARPLDGYTIKRAIGRGGFGEVYYATSDSGKEVALKLILQNLEVERRGVVQCMNLKCPNLLTIYDLKTSAAGDTFVVMEYVAGPSLAQVLAQHPEGLPLPEVRAWLRGLVEGVAYLHDHGIVHRDLKPANIFMEEGIVKIGDYGLAKLINSSQETGHSESVGTCHYMAPEIASGKYHKPIDIYAIGVILYEMITGRVPFESETVGEVLMKHLTARPDLSKLPEPYKTIVARALAKDPNQRPSRVYELLPPEDAPKPNDVRFIGDGKVSPPLPSASAAEAEETLRIGPEEPVFYIGPETRPPRSIFAPRARGNGAGGWRSNRHASRRAPVPPRARPVSAPLPPIPVEPPQLPSGRIRVAELASSMVRAAVLSIPFSFVAGTMLGMDLTAQPQQLAYLIVMAVLGSWSVLGIGKVMEGRTIDPTSRRLTALALGLALGTAGLLLREWLRVDFQTPGGTIASIPIRDPRLSYWMPLHWTSMPGWFLVDFALLSLASGGWIKLAARDRKARFRIWPILATGLIATILYGFVPYADSSSIAVAGLIALVTQWASPWSEYAARYARTRAYRTVA